MEDRLFGAPGQWALKRCSDPQCGLSWLDPMPMEEDIGLAYGRYYTHRGQEPAQHLSATHRLYQAMRAGYLARKYGYPSRRWQRQLGALLYLHPGARAHADHSIWFQPAQNRSLRLLEVGCGRGAGLQRMRELGWQNLEGVDVDGQAVRAAQERGLNVHLATLASKHYPDNRFDLVTMLHVVEHVHAPIDLFRECHRVLRSGGTLIVATPNIDSWGHGLFRRAWLGLDPPRHLYLFSVRTLRAALALSGPWDVVGLGATIREAGFIAAASSSIKKRGRADLGPASLWRQALSHGFYYAEWALTRVRPERGEEILLVARKPSG
jgi:2-polyprenyl-3-methyl-5-hydroxy-6-metoxy-1,4-benzoquinol methylase